MDKLKVGIIGLGVGEAHIAGYQKHHRVEVVKVCDFDAAVEKDKKASIGAIPFTTNPYEILHDPSISAVSICSYDNFHFEQICAAIDYDKHIFVEKPLCLYKEEALVIAKKLSEKPHLKISSNLILRRSERFLDLKKRITEDELGKLFHVNAAYNFGRLHKLTDGWRGDIPFYSVTYGGGVHLIDLVMWLFNERLYSVTSVGNNICTQDSKFQFNDVVSSVMKFQGGATAQLSSNFGCVYPHFHQLEVYGKNGTFVNQLEAAVLYKERDSVEKVLLTTAYPGIHKGDLLFDFIESILTNRQPLVSKKEVFDAMFVCFAIEESMNTGKEVIVNYID